MEYHTRLIVASIILAGFFFLVITENGYAGSTFGGPPCCEFPNEISNYCYGGEEAISNCTEECLNGGVCVFYPSRTCESTDGLPGAGSCEIGAQSSIPTISEWGLMILAVFLGIVGYAIIRRKRAAA